MQSLARRAVRIAMVIGLFAIGTTSRSASQTDGQYFLPLVARTYTTLVGKSAGVWMQEGGNPQRTGYTAVDPATPWTLLWSWNAATAAGGADCPDGNPEHGHCYAANKQPYSAAGAGLIFIPAGAQGLYAVFDHTGKTAWHLGGGVFNATPAYAGGFVFAGSADGRLFKVDVGSGGAQVYLTGSPINRGVLVAGGAVYVLTENGRLHKVDPVTLTAEWIYDAGAGAINGTGLAYSATRDVVLFGADDLTVHAVNAASGTRKWRVKPTPNPPGFPNQFLMNWPVVAEVNGLVLVRMRLSHPDTLWQFPRVQSNAEARAYLTANPAKQNLFALGLDDGAARFVPAVGFGGHEYQSTEPAALPTCGSSVSCAYLMVGPAPVVKVQPDGSEVAYVPFRSQQGNPNDARWDSHLGEMVLNDATLAGLAAGDLRWVQMGRRDSYIYITDELGEISMAGDVLFHAHWGANETIRIVNRAANLGLTAANPIVTAELPTLIRRIEACGTPNTVTHYTTCGMVLYGDTRYWASPGFWMYWNARPTLATGITGDLMSKGYTYVTGDLIVMQGLSGEVLVFKHSGVAP